jgi:hypothetical protein
MPGNGPGRLPMIQSFCEILESIGRQPQKRFDIIFRIKAPHNKGICKFVKAWLTSRTYAAAILIIFCSSRHFAIQQFNICFYLQLQFFN